MTHKRKIFWALVTVASLAGLALVILLWWVQSPGFDAWAKDKLVATLRDYGIEAEVDSLDVGVFSTSAKAGGVRLRLKGDTVPFLTLEQISVQARLRDVLKGDVVLESASLEKPVVRLSVDEQGNLNLSRITVPGKTSETKPAGQVFTGLVKLNGGSLLVDAKTYQLETELHNLALALTATPTLQKWHCSFSESAVRFQDKTFDRLRVDTEVLLQEKSAEVVSFGFNSPLGETTLSGKVFWNPNAALQAPLAPDAPPAMKAPGSKDAAEGFLPPGFRFTGTLFTAVDMAKTAQVFLPRTPLSGQAKLHATVAGDEQTYRVKGTLEPVDGSALGAVFKGLSLAYEVNSPYAPLSPQIESQVNVKTLKYDRIAISNFAAQVTASPEAVDIKPFELQVLNGSVKGNAHLAAALFPPQPLTLSPQSSKSTAHIEVTNLDMAAAIALGSSKPLPLAGKLASKCDLSWPGLKFEQAVGEATTTLAGVITNGKPAGTATKSEAKPKNPVWDAIAKTQPVEPPPATPVAEPPAPPGPVTPPAGIPLQGETLTTLAPDGVTIKQGAFKAGVSTLDVTGTYRWNRQTNLNVKFHTPELAEAQQLAMRFGVAPPTLTAAAGNVSYGVRGAGDFEGVISGNLTAPAVTGKLSLAEIVVNQSVLGRVTADFDASPTVITVKQAEIIQPTGGRMTAVLAPTGPTAAKADVTIDALQVKPLAEVAALFGPQPTVTNSEPRNWGKLLAEAGGVVSGKVEVGGLPALASLVKKDGLSATAFANLEGTGRLTVTEARTPYGTLETSAVRFSLKSDEYRLEQADLKLPVGLFSATGKVKLVKNGRSLDFSQSSYEVSAQGKDVDLATLVKTLQVKDPGLSGNVAVEFVSQGMLDRVVSDTPKPEFTGTVRSEAIGVANQKFSKVVGTVKGKDGIAALKLNTIFIDRPFEANGTVTANYVQNPETDEVELRPTLDGLLKVDRTPITALLGAFGVSPKNIGGIVAGQVYLKGPLYVVTPDNTSTLSAQNVQATANVSEFRLTARTSEEAEQDYTVTNDGPIRITAAKGEIRFDQCAFTGENTRLTVTGGIAASGKPSIGLNGDMDLKLLRSFTPNLFTRGVAHLKAAVSGTLESPRLSGAADIDEAYLRPLGFPLALEHGGGRILFTSNQAQIESFTADAGNGKIELSGGFVLDQSFTPRWRFGLRADDVNLVYPANVRSLLDGELTLQGNPNVQILSGNVIVRHAEYTERTDITSLLQSSLSNIPSSSVADLEVAGSNRSRLILDVNVEAADSLFIRNNLADIVGTASLKVRGTLLDPRLVGRILISRGQLEFRNDQYQVTRGVVVFPEARTENIFFDIQAETEIRSYRVIISFSGNTQKFNTALRSEPALPERSIMTLLATGNLPPAGQQDDPTVATQTGVSAASSILAELLSERVEERTNRLFGLNRFQIDPLLVGRGNDPTARLTIGRRITKDLSVTYSTNVATAQEQVILVEYRLTNNVSVVGIRDQKGNLGFDVRYTKRF
ncbi:MAG: translocation/assembly module TamB [Blastocatellia bacterium]|nr:translocation/assembly module TamB [Blastocatellia bacterium]